MTDDTLISPEYRALNAKLHEQRIDYGARGNKHLESVKGVCSVFGVQSLLDYGCGKQSLIEALRVPWARGYDPCVPGLDGAPDPAELVVCTDVLEHIEPEKIDAVLDHIQALAGRLVYLSISLVPAKKTLPDGRNTHLLVRPCKWWLEKLLARWEMDTCRNADGELSIVLRVEGEGAREPVFTNNIRK